MKLLLLVFLLFSDLLSISSLCHARGGVVSNGADHVGKAQAWNLGSEKLNVCIRSSEQYPIDKSKLITMVDQAFGQWKMYTESKQLKEAWPKDRPYLNFNVGVNQSCNGTEDIVFYFGVTTASIEAVLKSFVKPSAVSHLEKYDSKIGRGQGFVWIADVSATPSLMWGLQGQVFSLLMHEIGHVYGCNHVAGTIMRENLPEYLTHATPFLLNQAELTSFPWIIEHTRELYFNFDRGVRAIIPYFDNFSDAQKVFFQRLLKKPLSGRLMLGFIHGTEVDLNKGQLLVGEVDSKGKKLSGGTFRIEFDLGSRQDFFGSDSVVFNSIYREHEFSFGVPGFVMQGRLIINKLSGETVPISYARNRGSDEYIRLMFVSPQGSQEFFRGFLYDQGEGY